VSNTEGWREIVASSLDWDQAHSTLEKAARGLDPKLRGQRPHRFAHSPWELLEHIRITQHDLLEFSRNPQYKEIAWPDDYWPKTAAPPSDTAWDETLAAIRGDTEGFKAFTLDTSRDLTGKIPHGTGQTYLRTILLAVDHTSYHLAQLVTARQLLGSWPPE
jgi:uncharacterized damage-inducible protein DinB